MDVYADALHTHTHTLHIPQCQMASACLQPSSWTGWQLATSPVFPGFPPEDFSCTPGACSAYTKGSLEGQEVEPPQSNPQPGRSGGRLVSTPASCHAARTFWFLTRSLVELSPVCPWLNCLVNSPFLALLPTLLTFAASSLLLHGVSCLPNKLTEPLLRVWGTQTRTSWKGISVFTFASAWNMSC